MTARLRLLEVGPLSSVQDGGRPGLMRFGVPGSGPMDRLAFAMANAALGAPPGAAALEISAGGLVAELEGAPLTLALAGGGFRIRAGGVPRTGASAFPLYPGERIEIRAGDWGSWAVLAVAGRLLVPDWLGSCATHAISGLGGGLLRAGGEITITEPRLLAERHGAFPPPPRPEGVLRVVPGPQERFFDPAALATLLGQPFRLSPARDRMGQRLEGPALRPLSLDMPSGGVLRGSVQVAGDGVATVLMADHQTTGGYPRIATVIGPDLDLLAQMRPQDALRFVAVTPAEAIRIVRADHDARQARLADLAAPRDLAHRLARANLIGGVVDARD